MAKGGARSRSGPAPDPNALRRDRDEGEWTVLPADGRLGDPPPWPMPVPLERELALWADLWGSPQAIMWERLGQEHIVALYVRRMVEAEAAEAKVNLSTLVRQLADTLGITSPGMRANRWRIEVVREAATVADPKPKARDRFKVIDGDAEAI